MDLSTLRNFLTSANKKGYATSGENSSKKETDGSKSFEIVDGDWKEHDNYFGGEPYGGRTVVFYKNQPVWMMVYYGAVEDDVKNFEKVYQVLRDALKKMPSDAPYRGPKNFKDQNFEYINNWQGNLKSFSGEELILEDNKKVYWAKYVGGLINLRQD